MCVNKFYDENERKKIASVVFIDSIPRSILWAIHALPFIDDSASARCSFLLQTDTQEAGE